MARHDDEGRAYAEDGELVVGATSGRSSQPAHWPEGWDIADPPPRDAAPEMLGELLQSATPWTPPAPDQRRGDFDAAEIARLGALKPLAYDREREAAAKRLGCRATTLDRLVVEQRGGAAGASRQGRALARTPGRWGERHWLLLAPRRVVGGRDADPVELYRRALRLRRGAL